MNSLLITSDGWWNFKIISQICNKHVECIRISINEYSSIFSFQCMSSWKHCFKCTILYLTKQRFTDLDSCCATNIKIKYFFISRINFLNNNFFFIPNFFFFHQTISFFFDFLSLLFNFTLHFKSFFFNFLFPYFSFILQFFFFLFNCFCLF